MWHETQSEATRTNCILALSDFLFTLSPRNAKEQIFECEMIQLLESQSQSIREQLAQIRLLHQMVQTSERAVD